MNQQMDTAEQLGGRDRSRSPGHPVEPIAGSSTSAFLLRIVTKAQHERFDWLRCAHLGQRHPCIFRVLAAVVAA